MLLGVSSARSCLPPYHPDLAIPWSECCHSSIGDMGRQGRQVALLMAARVVEEVAGLPGLCHVRLLPLVCFNLTPPCPAPWSGV